MPPWDSFLTERDKAHLEKGWQKTKPFGYGPRAALLIIDNWTTVAGDEPEDLLDAVEHTPGTCGREGWDAVQHTKTLLEAARDRSMLVIHTMVSNPVERGIVGSSHNVSPPPYEFCAANFPVSGEMVLHKPHASAFMWTPLAAHLTTRGIDSLLVCGNSTSGCVRATVTDGCAMGFRLALVEECVFDRTEASHAMSLFDMNLKYADLVSLDDALRFVRSEAVIEKSDRDAVI